MSDKQFSQYLPEYLNGQLDKEERVAVELWIAASPAAQAELESLRILFQASADSDDLSPPSEIRDHFFAELSVLEVDQTRQKKLLKSCVDIFKIWKTSNPWSMGFAYTFLILFIGYSVGGYQSHLSTVKPSLADQAGQFEQLAMEVNALKLEVMQSQLANPMIDVRLKAVRYAYENKQLYQAMLDTLSEVISGDENTHVRTAAAQVLLTYLEQPMVELRFLQLCLEQSDTTVQLMMLGMLRDWNQDKARVIGNQIKQQRHLSPQMETLLNQMI